ncbi:TPA: homoserine O-succinyltransferase [Streptococcus suis]|jgi:homoserine O-succinyltransferase|uniref:Homoserine O-acetyltransferase n=1 Tax=Streptococcus suis TaxID=1307 RepID=A0A9X4MK52_STRSU|nr:homoserine O-succinyltransferase [Streptococcus parasuis]MBP6171648.1 homoserine O-succinyltransferase [Streptococcus sp.]MDG4511832.1 homoserine O-succinyltransferase [Streptococcus suis]MBP7055154.1 homoserine O-succinyltransferase [Streptococcus sp.]MBP8703663.1 homoserine O-succinyltransferase [Streptococcus sp.]MDG4523862.1 homoserine O-succinyltransferase [Streptococcus suis]
MPIKIEKSLPAVDILKKENIFVMDSDRASHQDIRPIKILILNLMPQKIVTETQLLRLLANTPLQLEVEFLYMASHESKNTHSDHLEQFYKTFEQVKDSYFDGLIVTGAPVENLPFEAVDYWSELVSVLEWSNNHVFSTLHICWGAQAGLYARYGVQKHNMNRKLSGIYRQDVVKNTNPLMRGFDDDFQSPHSRYTEVKAADISHLNDLEILSCGEEVGLSILASKNLREVYSFGHLEYDRDTLAKEYQRDCLAGKNPHIPENYFRNDDPSTRPALSWNLPAAQFFTNWINYAVYQETPYDWKLFEDSALSASL